MSQCEQHRMAISAIADGEDPGVEPALVERHVAGCAECRRFAQAVAAWPRPSSLAEAPAMPDLSRRVVKLNAVADRAGRWRTARLLLAVVAVEILVLSVTDLLGRGESASAHASRHLGAFSVAYAVGLLVVVVRPARARTMLPVTAVLAGALAVTALVDIVDGRVPLLGEAAHLPELLSVLLVWLLARPSRVPDATRMPSYPPLRSVEPDDDPGEAATGS